MAKATEKIPRGKLNRTVDLYTYNKNEVQWFYSFKYLKKYYQGKKVLDMGCGTGDYLQAFGPDAIGIDASLYNLKMCKKKGLNVQKHDLNKALPFKSGTFDVVFCSHVMEHLDSPINGLREMNRVLRPGGTVIIGLPTDYSLPRVFIDNFFKAHPGHLYSFSLDNLEQLFKKTGFAHEATYLDLNLAKRLRMGFMIDLINKFPAKMFMWLSPAFWYVGKKTE